MLGTTLTRAALVLGFALVAAAAAPPVDAAATPCCEVTNIDLRTRLVTARDHGMNRTLQFKVMDYVALRELRVGQRVFADFKAMKVSVRPDGRAPCCEIVFVSSPRPAPPPACCGITAINPRTGLVTATDKATGRKFEFRVANRAVLAGLTVGQPIHANFKTMTVSVRADGTAPCCAIVSR